MESYLVAGIVLASLTALSMVLVIALHPFIKRVTNTYWYWLFIGLATLIYMLIVRFINAFEAFNKLIQLYESIGGINSVITSKALLLDLCPFSIFVISVFLICDPSRKLASIIAPFGIFGGIITIFSQIVTGDNENASLTAQYIFLGFEPNNAYFIMHYLLCVVGCSLLANTPNHKWWTFLYEHIFAILYFGYICILVFAFGVKMNTTGVSKNDWLPGGEYYAVSQILNLDYPFCMIVGYGLSYLAIFAIFWLWYLIQKYCKPYHINAKFNGKKWYRGWYQIN